MTKLNVIPIEPSEAFAKVLLKAKAKSLTIKADGISIIPPTKVRATWRVKFNLPSMHFDRSAGRDLAQVNAVFLEARKIRMAQLTASTGASNYHSHFTLLEAIEHYISNGGKNGKWSSRSKKNRTKDFSELKRIAAHSQMKCSDFNVSHFRTYVNKAGTPGRGKDLISHCRLFLEWGATVGYFSEAQTKIYKLVTWTKPKGSNYKAPKSRSDQAKFFNFDATNRKGGSVPTYQQVRDYAEAVGKLYLHGEGLIYTSALMGTRASETLIYTASKSVFLAGQGNYVDLGDLIVKAHYQINDDPESLSKLTKGQKVRDIVIPSRAMIPKEYEIDFLPWLAKRSKEALEEQAAGKNPLALLFPAPRGGVWHLDNLDTRVLTPAHKALGWKMSAQIDVNGRQTRKSRFTLHSMRDRFGTMAAEDWGYSEVQLLDQGSWEDQQTVRRFYIGTTDDTVESVKALHTRGKVANG